MTDRQCERLSVLFASEKHAAVEAFVVDAFVQRVVGWHASTSKKVDQFKNPLRIVLRQRQR